MDGISPFDLHLTPKETVGKLAYGQFILQDGTQSGSTVFTGEHHPAEVFASSLPKDAAHPLSVLTGLEQGTSVAEVMELDPSGEYMFLYTGRNDVPRVSTHYTTDGYYVEIHYDETAKLTEIVSTPLSENNFS